MNRRSGFTLVESLVAIGIIGVLLGLTLPAVQRARESALRAGCLNNLRQIGIALHHFHAIHRQFPPLDSNAPDPNAILGWMPLILAQLENESAYEKCIRHVKSIRSPATIHRILASRRS